MGCGSLIEGVARGCYKRPGHMSGMQIVLALVIALVTVVTAETGGKFGYFSQDNDSFVLIRNGEWDVQTSGRQTEFSFRTCSRGEFLHQRGANGDFLLLSLINGTLEFSWSIGENHSIVFLGNDMNNDEWWTVGMQGYLGNFYLNVSRGGRVYFSEIISNSTFRNYFTNIDFAGTEGLYVGKGFTGCVMEGPTVIFSTYNRDREFNNVLWSNTTCAQNVNSCASENGDIDDCYNHPCNNGGTCIDGINTYTCRCPHLYTGVNCDNDTSVYGCAVDPCLNGGTCEDQTSGMRNYRCDCPTGFVGINCEGNIDECGTNPCQNDVPCIDTVGGYDCNCTGSGYNGTRCEIDIDECMDPSICGTGQCFNNPGGFTCDCSEGFFGPKCQDIDECSSNPCQNGARCQNGVNIFTCECQPGYSGSMCEEDINDCLNVVCSNPNTECRDLVNNHECVCKPGYRGNEENCVEINECTELDPCRNGASCQDNINDYSCVCVPGYIDKNCSTNVDECASNPCQNGATCVDEVNRFRCQCVTGYDGDQCQTDIDECTAQFSEPCFHGGTCNDAIGSFDCSCVLGYTGTRCETDINECVPNPCGSNSITCTHGIGYYNCTCKPGYTGNQCQTDINECSSSPCKNGATCVDEVNGFTCACASEWMGSICNIPYNACSPDLKNCQNGATCQTSSPSRDFNCTCLLGFTGSQCETNIDDCRPDSCRPPFECFDAINNFTCACPVGYQGLNCSEEILECASSPCQNEATCIEGIGNYTCECNQREATVPDGIGNRTYTTGYEGRNCELDIDECQIQPTLCLNGGDCQNEDGAFQCKCGRDPDGYFFSGSHCEVSTTYCIIDQEAQLDPPACKNNGTCKGLPETFVCTCAPGFTGRRCKTDIDECESSPCQYNGTCNDAVNSYTCDCIPGIEGDNCEINIDECASNPCLNGGQCIDEINRFECNCSDTGFKGDTCEIDIDDCESQPCYNGATCYDKVKDFNCSCYLGYNGKQCEIDINECESSPCQFNSSCLQKSNQTLYEIDHPGFDNTDFSYVNASGYLCECVAGSTGVNCETNINDCEHENCLNGATCIDKLNGYKCDCIPGYKDFYCQTDINECLLYQPCQYGSSCIDKIADYDCECPPLYNGKPYAGKNCTFELTSCQSNECQNGATCQPYLINELKASQDYECLCTNGFTGRYCNVSTTMSFLDSTSNIQAILNITLDVSVTFRFRTTLRDALLFGWVGQLTGVTRLFATLELKDGRMYLGYNEDENGLRNMSVSDLVLNDAEWHSVEVTKNNESIVVTLSDSRCTSNECSVSAAYSSDVQESQVGFFGSFEDSQRYLIRQTVSKSEFVGCMQDVTIRETRLALNIQSDHSFTNMGSGCPRSPQCHKDTCNMNGDCIDLWNTFHCNCFRPNLGTRCETAYVAATFGYQDIGESSATFDLSSDIISGLTQEFDLSFFFRTRQSSSKILYFGSRLDGTYLTLAMQDGNLEIIVSVCNSPKTLVTDGELFNDGEQHLVRFHRNVNSFAFYVDNSMEYSETLPSPCNFQSSSVYFGGSIPPANKRRKRGTLQVTAGSTINDFINKESYKGTIQDVQLGTMSLEFYALENPSLSDLTAIPASSKASLTQDEVTDPMCNMTTPCENNSTCSDVFFNDYRCDCLLGYRGKNCSELDFCVTGKCPEGSICQSLLDGFECVSNATFDGRMSYAVYSHTLSNTSVISAFSFKFRTLAMNGYVLMFGDNAQYFKVRIQGSYITVEYKLDNANEVVLSADYPISDSKLYLAEVREHESDVTLTLYDPEKVMEYKTVNGSKPVSTKNYLNDILKKANTEVVLGTRVSGVDVQSRVYAYHGCLLEVRIGGILLPFFTDDEFINNTSKEKFLLQPDHQFTAGCQAGIGCISNQCKHSSVCVPDFYSYVCECNTGYTGKWCQGRVDYCSEDPCVNGQCVSNLDQYECRCDNTGYSGTRCETDVDECASNATPCLNNGSCENQNGTFSCSCTSSFLGDTCEIAVGDTCSDSPCVHGTCTDVNTTLPDPPNTVVETYDCTCTAGYTGYKCEISINYCAGFPCLNGATCQSRTESQDYRCTCPAGFTGGKCQTNIDDCPTNACLNGGQCVDGLNTYTCNCTEYFEGADCSLQVDECSRNQQCQNSGTCNNRFDGPAFCTCTGTGYQGLYCEEDIDECLLSDTCKNGANCTNTDGSFLCDCTLGYEGMDCGMPNCDLVNCKNSATCAIENQQWQCVCPAFYEGELCGIKGPCANEPCVAGNTEKCSQNITEDTFTCHCKPGWEEKRCDTDIDECSRGTQECLFGATCMNENGSYSCQCDIGYTGAYCGSEINECASTPCENNGICLDLIGRFECNCTNTGYTNETCSDDVDECYENNPCYNSATCKNTVGSFECICTDGWEGSTCETKASAAMDDDITWYIVGPVVGLVLILITVGIIWFLFCVRNKRATRGAYSPSRQEVTGSRVELGNVMKKPPLERLI